LLNTRRRLAFALSLGVVLAAGLAWAWASGPPRTAEQRQTAARDLLAAVHVSATVVSSSLLASSAEADFGLKQGIRSVGVRVVDILSVELRIEADRDVALAQPPPACLAGPYWAPDDAGLESRCWGEPDIGQLLATAMPTDGAGRLVLTGHRAVVLNVALRRGESRCDYPPGAWDVTITVDPMIDGTPVTGLDPIRAPVAVPVASAGSLTAVPVGKSRFCSDAAAIYLEQGEPPGLAP
jgi:hypothetical protein